MSAAWEGGYEKEGVMMVEVRDLGNHEEARRMKVGGHNIMNQPSFQKVVKSTFVGEWRQDLQVMAIVGVQREELMTMVSGRRLVEVKQRYLNLLE
jgi:ribosomal protein L5